MSEVLIKHRLLVGREGMCIKTFQTAKRVSEYNFQTCKRVNVDHRK